MCNSLPVTETVVLSLFCKHDVDVDVADAHFPSISL